MPQQQRGNPRVVGSRHSWRIGAWRNCLVTSRAQLAQSEHTAERNEDNSLVRGAIVRTTPVLMLSRSLSPNAIGGPLINEQTYNALIEAHVSTSLATMLYGRTWTNSLGNSLWLEHLQAAMYSESCMHALLAGARSFLMMSPDRREPPVAFSHHGKAVALFRRELSETKISINTVQTLSLLACFEFASGRPSAALMHLQGSRTLIDRLGGFRDVPWATLISILVVDTAASAILKLTPVFPARKWDYGPLEKQIWWTAELAADISSEITATESLDLKLLSKTSLSPWHTFLAPSKRLFALADYFQTSVSASDPRATSTIPYLYNQCYAIKSRLVEQYIMLTTLYQDSTSSAPTSNLARLKLEAATCLALMLCQVLVIWDNPRSILFYEPIAQLRDLLEECHKSTLRYGTEIDKELLLWVLFIATAVDTVRDPQLLYRKTGGEHEPLFSPATAFNDCLGTLHLEHEQDLTLVLETVLWHERSFRPLLRKILLGRPLW